MSIGLDLDSEDTLISYSMGDNWLLTFFPFNFEGEVGRNFPDRRRDSDFFVEGSPSAVRQNPTGDENWRRKLWAGFS